MALKKMALIAGVTAAMTLSIHPLNTWGTTNDSADQDEGLYKLEPLTVVATRTLKSPLDTPASVSVITENEIKSISAEHPFKALTISEGIWPRQYRGLADYWARPLIRGQRALILVDGVNWHDYGYYSDTAAIPMADLERIDVARGPFSALYGSLAQTGVINYTTKIPEELERTASISYGELNSLYFNARIADKPFAESPEGLLGKDFFYSLSFKSRTTDGYVTTPSFTSPKAVSGKLDPNTPVVTGWKKDIDPQTGKTRYEIGNQGTNWYEDNTLFLKTGYDFSSDSRIWYSFNLSKFEYGWKDGESYLKDKNGTQIHEGETYLQEKGTTYKVSLNPLLFTSDPKSKESLIHTINFNHSIPDLVDITGVLAYNDKESISHNRSSSRYKIEDNSLSQADLAATFHSLNDKLLLTIGLQGIIEKATVTEDNLSDRYDADSRTSLHQKTTGENLTLGSFVQVEYAPIEPLTAYVGGRYDYWKGTSADYANASGDYLTYPDMEDGQFSPKISLVYRPAENGVIRTSYGEAFTAPSLYYRTASYYWSGGGTVSMADPNPDLGPTTNQSWEIGTEWHFINKRLRVKATYFENDFNDLIVNKSKNYTLADGTVVNEKKRVNAEEAEVNGIETGIEASLPFNMRIGLFYAHNWSEYTKTEASSKLGWEMDETPTDMWSLWTGYFGQYVDASINYRFCDSRYDDEYAPYADNAYKGDDAYHVMDAKVTYKHNENIAVSFSVDNLFDEEYYEYYKAAGRTLLGTVTLSL